MFQLMRSSHKRERCSVAVKLYILEFFIYLDNLNIDLLSFSVTHGLYKTTHQKLSTHKFWSLLSSRQVNEYIVKRIFFCCTIKSKSISLNLRLFESRHRSNRRPLSVPRLTRFPEWLAKKWMTTHSVDLIYIKFQVYTHLPKVCQFIVFPKIYFIRIKNY